MTDSDDEVQPELVAPLVDMSRWDDGMFERAVALAAFTQDVDEAERDELPDYDW